MWRLVLCYGTFGFGYIVPATFLPAAARQLVADPGVFGWTWPVFGLAAACSTAATSRAWNGLPPRKLWAGGQLVMAVGLLAPAVRMSLPTLMVSAVCVGGTFMVVTMAGLQEARRVAGHGAPRLMAAMTAAFAVGQLIGPFTVNLIRSTGGGSVALPYAVAAASLLLGAFALVFRLERAETPRAVPANNGIA
jgi:predicted MFS family arabinose efflux permease